MCGASRGDTISNCDSSRLGRLSYESPDVRGTDSAPFRGGDAPAMRRDGAREDAMDVESEDEEEFGVRRAARGTTAGRKRRAIEVEEEEDE